MLRIGTWNVEYALGRAANQRRAAVLRRNPADIWILTETHDALKPSGGFRGAHSPQRPFYGIHVRRRSRWVSIWSRLPIVATDLRISDRERTKAIMVRTPSGLMIVFATVMPWRGDVKRKIDAAVRAQLADLRALRARYPGIAICVAGDFNTDMMSGQNYLTKRAHVMIRRALARLEAYVASGPGRIRRGALQMRPIDHIALPRSWKARARVTNTWEGKVGSPRLSDHSGLVVRVLGRACSVPKPA